MKFSEKTVYSAIMGVLLLGGAASLNTLHAENASIEKHKVLFDQNLAKKLDKSIPTIMQANNTPSVTVSVVQDGKIVYEKAFGYANRSKGIKATPQTLYYIASITKTFTATLAMILRDQGIVDLNTPVQKYLPANIRVPVDPMGGEITLRHLLSHSSSLPGDPPNRKNLKIDGPVDPEVWDAYSIKMLYEALRTTKIERAVGSKWAYSNYGLALAGHVLERAAGKPFETLLRELILQPLGMNNTSITLSPEQEKRLAAFYWPDEGNKTEQVRARFGDVAAMGGITSSVHDMAQYARFLLKKRDHKGDILSLASLKEMRKPVIGDNMGLGWMIRKSTNGAPDSYQHNGELDGHRSAFWYSPSQNTAISALCNSGDNTCLILKSWVVMLLDEDPNAANWLADRIERIATRSK